MRSRCWRWLEVEDIAEWVFNLWLFCWRSLCWLLLLLLLLRGRGEDGEGVLRGLLLHRGRSGHRWRLRALCWEGCWLRGRLAWRLDGSRLPVSTWGRVARRDERSRAAQRLVGPLFVHVLSLDEVPRPRRLLIAGARQPEKLLVPIFQVQLRVPLITCEL